MINLFPPGAVSAMKSWDGITLQPAQEAHKRKLEEYFGEENGVPNEHQKIFIAFAEIYYEESHLDYVAQFYNFIDWTDMSESILHLDFSVPDIRNSGTNEARRLLLDQNLVGQNLVDQNLPDQNLPDQNLPDQNLPDQNISDQDLDI